MDPITIAAIIAGVLGLVTTGASFASNRAASKRQEQHDFDVIEANQENAKEMFDYENAFNRYSNAGSQMVNAGFNRALLYGNSMPEVLDQSSGSGSASNVGFRPDFESISRSIDPTQIADLKIAEANGVALRNQANSEARLADGRYMEALASAQQKTYDTKVKKMLENTIIDQATRTLELTGEQVGSIRANTARTMLLTPIEFEESMSRIGINHETAAKIREETMMIKEEIKNQPFVRNHLAAQARYFDRAGSLCEANERLSAYEAQELGEKVRNMQIERLARECGLTARRPGHESKNAVNFDKMSYEQQRNFLSPAEKSFCQSLMMCGYSEREALCATYYYTFGSLNDLTSDWINAGSRALSGVIAGAGMAASKGFGGKASPSYSPTPITGNRQRMR